MIDRPSEEFGGYAEFLRDLKARIQVAQLPAAMAVNRGLVLLYWQRGRAMLLKQQEQGWGAKIIERLPKELR